MRVAFFLGFLMARMVISPPAARACSVCFLGISDNPVSAALGMAVLCLFLVLLAVFIFLGKFLLDMRKRRLLNSKEA